MVGDLVIGSHANWDSNYSGYFPYLSHTSKILFLVDDNRVAIYQVSLFVEFGPWI